MSNTGSRRTLLLGQYRLRRLQVVNWGTFCGYKDFEIDERGTLFTGPSGCGKSTLLDGHSVALLPTQHQRFNASADLVARGAKQGSRNLADYVRGAWSENDDEFGRSQVRYLRGGKPTWSGLAATYDDGKGSVTTAAVVKYFTGTETDGSALKTQYLLIDGDFLLTELDAWATAGKFSKDALRKCAPNADQPNSESEYTTRLAKRVGIGDSKLVLSLLGRAKAMKNVGDLNLFIRDNMLDEPGTFKSTQSMLASYTPLEEAYKTAERALRQAQILAPVPEAWAQYCAAQAEGSITDALVGDPAEQYVRAVHLRLIDTELTVLAEAILALESVLATTSGQAEEARGDHQSLENQLKAEGQVLEDYKRRKAEAESLAGIRRRAWALFAAPVTALGLTCPVDGDEFAALSSAVAELLTRAEEQQEALEPNRVEVYSRASQAKRDHEAKDGELQALSIARSLVGQAADARRQRIAQGAGVPADDLVYAAELIDVADDEERWRPAAEKVLRSFGMRLLIPERHRTKVTAYIDSHDMRGLVEYSIVTPTTPHPSRLAPSTLAGKLTVDTGHPAGPWLAGQLAQQFSHACVETAADLDGHTLAVTVGGTVKSGSNRYRKDDRPELTNRASWILGGNIEAKRAALADEVAELAQERKAAEDAAGQLTKALDDAEKVISAGNQAKAYTVWDDLDYWAKEDLASALEERIAEIVNDSVDLARLQTACEEAKEKWQGLTDKCSETRIAIKTKSERAQTLRTAHAAQSAKPHNVGDEHRRVLDKVFADLPITATPDNIGQVSVAFRQALDNRRKEATVQAKAAHAAIKYAIDKFIENWPGTAPDESGDVDASGASFAALHEKITATSLPEATARFQRMIGDDMVPSISVLYRAVEASAATIRERIRMVNTGLGRVEFNASTHLQIHYQHREPEPATEFKANVDELLRNANKARADMQEASAQFLRVRALMARFTGTELEDRHWREAVLDVRSSFTFWGREETPEGETTHTYRNTASNSGGEQEKLVAFCLAAALSYNLADDDSDGRPRFAPLMLDEAFSKSDESFASQALSAFAEFGFQLLIAAPIRMSGVLEPFIGQAVLVDKKLMPDGAHSAARTATFGELAVRRVAENDGLNDAHA